MTSLTASPGMSITISHWYKHQAVKCCPTTEATFGLLSSCHHVMGVICLSKAKCTGYCCPLLQACCLPGHSGHTALAPPLLPSGDLPLEVLCAQYGWPGGRSALTVLQLSLFSR
jgi:hypothetical protein